MERARRVVQMALAVVLLALAGFGLVRLAGEALADGPWEPTEEIPVGSTLDWDTVPDVAVDGLGRAYAVWQGYGSVAWTVRLSVRPALGSWSNDENLFAGDYSYTNRMEPVVAANPTGDLHLLWSEDYPDPGVKYCILPEGGERGPAIKVNDSPEGGAGDPAVALDASGNVYAVWSDTRNGDRDIYFSMLPLGGAWSANSRVNDDVGTAGQSSPAIAVDPAGNAYAVWTDGRDDVYDVFFSFRPAGGSWGAGVKVNDDVGPAWQSEADIAVDALGNAYAVWTDARNLDRYDVFFSFRPAGGTWSQNVQVDSGAGTADRRTPKIAVDHLGYAHAIWTDERSDPSGIYSSVRSPSGEWGASVQVNDETFADYYDLPTIAVDTRGNVYAVWRGTDNNIYASRKIVDPWPIYRVYLPLLQNMD